MPETITIDRRYCGPPDSGNGGYTCGVAAEALGANPATVTLRVPPPLDRPLRVDHAAGRVRLVDGDAVVAEAVPADATAWSPGIEPIGFGAATTASERFDESAYRALHPFPTCYTCGPDRTPGDALRIFPAPIGRPGVVAWPWVPAPSLTADDGLVDLLVVWAALDCPAGLAWIADADVAAVLGRMTVVVHRRPSPGEELVVGGWRATADGRKLAAGSAIWSADGEVLAENRAIWFELTEEQRAAFTGAAG
jgi:hypothetical protein